MEEAIGGGEQTSVSFVDERAIKLVQEFSEKRSRETGEYDLASKRISKIGIIVDPEGYVAGIMNEVEEAGSEVLLRVGEELKAVGDICFWARLMDEKDLGKSLRAQGIRIMDFIGGKKDMVDVIVAAHKIKVPDTLTPERLREKLREAGAFI